MTLQPPIDGAIQKSISSLTELVGVATHGQCPSAQYEKLVAAMFNQLRSRNIPRGEEIDPQTFQQISVTCLSVLGSTLSVWMSSHSIPDYLLKKLVQSWKDIRSWIIFLY